MPLVEGAEEVRQAVAAESISELISSARAAHRIWRETSLRERLGIIRELRNALAKNARELCSLFPIELPRSAADSLTAEIIPLAEACRYLEKHASKVLAPYRPATRLRPLWLRGVTLEIRREPLGVVLIVGPANYPLFLPGVQAVQALVAGNAVVLKPGRGGHALASTFKTLAVRSGLPPDLLLVLDEGIENVQAAISAGVDKIVFTGSNAAGRQVYRQASSTLTPVTMELSGEDAVFVLASADLDRAVDAVYFGMKLNGGETCIVPRRAFVWQEVASEFRRRLLSKFDGADVPLSITTVRDEAEALEEASRSPYALGATVFGERSSARALARRIDAGAVVVNDMIVPTADPRLPFGGRGASGFGTTRGAEGLGELTTVKAVAIQRSRRLRHLEPHPANAEELFAAFLATSHSRAWKDRAAGVRSLLRAVAPLKSKG